MGVFGMLLKVGAVVAALVAVLIGSLIAGVPTKLGVWTYLANTSPGMIGTAPAFMQGVEWGYTWEQFAEVDFKGQTAVVTGANAGIGFGIAQGLSEQGATVIMVCRNPKKCSAAAEKISKETGNNKVTYMTMDTSSLKSVRAFAEAFPAETIDMLYLNAGIFSPPKHSDDVTLSEDNIELVYATNVVGHHLLYKLLEPKLKATTSPRVILTSSSAHEGSFDFGVATDLKSLNNPPTTGWKLYGQSKLAQIVLAQETTRRLGEDSNIFINSFHPGVCQSEFCSKIPALDFMRFIVKKVEDEFMWNSRDCALTGLYLGAEAHTKGIRGKYFHPQSIEVAPFHPTIQPGSDFNKAVFDFTDSLVADK